MIASANDRFIPRLLLDAPDFRRLWLGQTISVLGDQVTQLGLPLVAVLTLGADASQMGTLTAVALLPHLLFSLPAGVWLHRLPMPVILGLILLSEFGAGLGVMILDINIGSINNARIGDRIRARANGAYRMINYGVRPIGALFGGFLGTAIGVREALFVVSIAGCFGILWMVGSPILGLRDLPDAVE